jgi:ligand-binding SRPBCC domain-containing protein
MESMGVYHLDCEMLVKRPLKEVFTFFENPANLGKITPGWLSFNIVTKDVAMAKGAQFDYVIKWLGLPMKWRSLISRYEPPYLFVDEQLIGPYQTWHHEHTFAETDRGVIVGDHLEYSLPLGPLGAIAQAVMVKRQLESVFRYRQAELAKIFSGQTEELIRPSII